jgi:uncharacterized Zn finger protein
MMWRDDDWDPYIPAAERRRQAAREAEKLAKKRTLAPVKVEGRAIAATFWGKAWCQNLERYSDYSNRLPRGRTYLRNGSVIDLRIVPGEVDAWVSGSHLYEVKIKISPLSKPRWSALCADCTGAIDSLVALLEGRFSKAVMERICREKTGLFPFHAEIKFKCSCPDSASMCKHIAAVLYGIGARLDTNPELLFTLRTVDKEDMITKAGEGLTNTGKRSSRILQKANLSELFGIDIAEKPRRKPRIR